MRHVRLAAICASFLAFALPAQAADLPARAVAPIAPAWSWAGFYAGLNVGGAWARTGGANGSGVIGGGQVGYNWQTGPLVVGIEADIQASGLSGTGSVTGPGLAVSETQKQNYFGTVRGRLGYASGAWLAYVTGGWLYTTVKHDGLGTAGVIGAYSASNAKSAWTIGGGFEWMFAPRWSAKLEYLYAQIGGNTNVYATTVPALAVAYSSTDLHVARVGVNYHF